MTVRRVAAACVLALLAGVAPAAAAPPPRVIAISGAKNAYVDVTFPARFRLHTDEFEYDRPAQVTAKGTYGGFYAVPLDRGPAAVGAGVVVLKGIPSLAHLRYGLGTIGWLPAGRYRVHLLADGATTVRVRAEGLRRDLSLTPAKPSLVSAQLVHRTAAGAEAPVDRTVIPVNLRPATVTVLAAQQDQVGVGSHQHMCLYRAGHPEECEIRGSTRYSTPGGWRVGRVMAYYPGQVPLGEAEAEFLDVTAGLSYGMHAFVLTVS